MLTPEVVQQAQTLLFQGRSPGQVAQQLGIKSETLRKAILQGRVSAPAQASSTASPPDERVSPSGQAPKRDAEDEPRPAAPERPRPACEPKTPPRATDQSQRTVQDATAADGLGMACTRVLDRLAASLGLLPGGAATQFTACRDVPFGGVMCALPALAENGLFRHLSTCFPSLGGYYTTLQVMTLLGYMALLPDQDGGAITVPATRRTGEVARPGPDSGGPLSAVQTDVVDRR